MKTLTQFKWVALGAVMLFFASCKKDEKAKDLSGTFYGQSAPFGGGTARTYITVDKAGKPATLGIRFTESVLSGLPSGTGESEYPLNLPAEAKITGFDHVVVDWNPVGHEPKAIYGLPHFDFHFYRVTKADLDKVIPGPDTTSVPAKYIAPDYSSGVMAVPDMGVHWVDTKAPEFQPGGKFTDTWIYGYYHGQLTFEEDMATTAWLATKPDYKITIKQPQAFQKQGYYPGVSHTYFDAAAKEYVVSLENLKWADAN